MSGAPSARDLTEFADFMGDVARAQLAGKISVHDVQRALQTEGLSSVTALARHLHKIPSLRKVLKI